MNDDGTFRTNLEADRRTILQNAKMAIRDIFDAFVELVTNADDRYQILGGSGRIEIEVQRRRGEPSKIRVRDFADGMSKDVMDRKLSRLGGRESGLADGQSVRGTNSRGAKDIASLGQVKFESIADDGQYHRCKISPFMEYTSYAPSAVTEEIREELGLQQGTGTLVTIELNVDQSIPLHDNLVKKLSQLVSLRDILNHHEREVVLKDLNRKRDVHVQTPSIRGTDRVKEKFEVPGYPGATAKLIIRRAPDRFDREHPRFRLGGILIKSRHAVHEATYFASELEADPHAAHFWGRLVCPALDDLSNDFDERFAQGLEPTPENPRPIIDPARRGGLTRDHPFVQALFGEVLKRFRPLVAEERQREERERAAIESQATRRRLNKLEKAALEFMKKLGQDDPTREPEEQAPGSGFLRAGYVLSPPYCHLLVGHSRRFALQVLQEAWPELEVGATVEITCQDDTITSTKKFATLEPHPAKEGVIRATWKITAKSPTPTTGIKVQCGPISTDSVIEVFASEADRYADIDRLTFQRRRYRTKTGAKNKTIRIFAPLSLVNEPAELDLSIAGAGQHLTVHGDQTIRPIPELGVARCEIKLRASDQEASGTITAKLDSATATAEIKSVLPAGAGIKIKLEDIDLANQRYRWQQNVLEIAARHPSLHRYLGPKVDGFPGQESDHFRLLLAEIVSDAVCAKMMSRNVDETPEDYEDADWDLYYAEYSKYMTLFLPVAHSLQLGSL
ncbi:MAG: hypothetical protein F4Y74_14765 [Gemmatimonadales bacterium]|nr:hypothetical protein [Gemmatimonadales bacterium]MYG20420.1 hypothetical protein [Gemmatimonadales bacterium]